MADAPMISPRTQMSPSESSDTDRQEGTPAATPPVGHTASNDLQGEPATQGAEQAEAGVRLGLTLTQGFEAGDKERDDPNDNGLGGPAEALLIDLSDGHSDNSQVGEKADPNTGYHGNGKLVCQVGVPADQNTAQGRPDPAHPDEITGYQGEHQLEGLRGAHTDYQGDSQKETPSNPSSGTPSPLGEERAPEGAREAASALLNSLHSGTGELGPADTPGHQQEGGEACSKGALEVRSPVATGSATIQPAAAAGNAGARAGAAPLTAGLSVSTTGGARRRDNSELGGAAAGPASPPQEVQPTEPVNQSRQVEEGAQEPATGVPATTHNRQVESAPEQGSGLPEAHIRQEGSALGQDSGPPETHIRQEGSAPEQASGHPETHIRQVECAPEQCSGTPETHIRQEGIASEQGSGPPETHIRQVGSAPEQGSGPPETHIRQEGSAPEQGSGPPETYSRQQGGAPAPQQAEGRPAPACEVSVARPGSGDLLADQKAIQEATPLTNVQEVQGTSADQDIHCISATPTVDAIASEASTNPTVEDDTSQSIIGGTTTRSTVEDVKDNITIEDTSSPSQEAAALSVAPLRSRAKSLMEVDQEDNMSDSGLSADFSPGSTLDMDVEPSNETPIEQEIRRHAEREETLRKERGLAPAPDHQQYVEVKMKPILNREPADSLPPKEKARQRAGAQMQRDIRMESQREEDLVQLGKVMGTYDRGLAQELREKKMIFEQNSPDTSAMDLAALKKMNRSSYGESETVNRSSNGEVESLSSQVMSPTATVHPRGSGEKKGPSYAEANGSNVIIVDYNVLLHPVAIGRGQPTQAQVGSPTSGPSNTSQSSANGLPKGRFSASPKSTNGFQFGSTNTSANGLQSGTASVSQSLVNGLKVGPSSASSEGQLSPLLPTTGEPVQENPFFRLKSKSPQSLLEQEIREVRERENELRKLRHSLYGGQEAKAATGGEGPAEATSPAQEPGAEQEALSGQGELLYSGKLEVTWPPRSCGLQDGQDPGQEERSPSTPRQRSALVQRWESGMVSGQQSLDDEQ